MQKIFEELKSLWMTVNQDEINNFVEIVSGHKGNIICLGAGRMGYAVQGFAMRLSHLGFSTFMIGDTTLPRIQKDDLVIVNSSSGETPSIILLTQLARKHGAKLLIVTSNSKSSLGELADHQICYGPVETNQLMKSAYEQFTFLLFDHISYLIFNKNNLNKIWVEGNHSILE